MHARKRRSPLWGQMLISIIIFIASISVIIGVGTIIDKYSELKKENVELQEKIDSMKNDSIEQDIKFSIYIKNKIEKQNELNETIKDLTRQNNELTKENKELKTAIENQINIEPLYTDEIVDFKSYMDYRMISDISSFQYQLQQQAYTNELGIRVIDNIPLVAVGTGWGLNVGDHATVYCENGNQFNIIVGDIKQDAHTQSDNITGAANGCRCEFIVDTDYLDSYAKICGNIAVLNQYSGLVVNVVGN